MLHSAISPSQKRQRLRQRLKDDGPPLAMPGAFNALSAVLIERHGFEALYLSGAVLAAELALPDVGLTTLSEVARRAQEVSRVTSLPVLVDADTGFGEPMNVARTVQVLEDAGVAALHLEDQENPKRCGHLEGKTLVSLEVARRRIAVAVAARRDSDLVIVARTDARATEGIEGALRRAQSYVDEGADVIFAEALDGEDEFVEFSRSLSVPVLANATEFGRSPALSMTQYGACGVRVVIYPVSLLRLAMGSADRALSTLAREGSLDSHLSQMQTRAELYDLLDYGGYREFDSAAYDFRLPS